MSFEFAGYSAIFVSMIWEPSAEHISLGSSFHFLTYGHGTWVDGAASILKEGLIRPQSYEDRPGNVPSIGSFARGVVPYSHYIAIVSHASNVTPHGIRNCF